MTMDIQKMQAELTSIMNGMIDAKTRLQNEIPTKQAIFSERDQVAKDLLRAQEKFKKLLVDLDLIGEATQPSSIASGPAVTMSIDPARILAVTCRNAVKEKLDGFQNLVLDQVTTGGPLDARFYKEINPSMPDAAIANIEKKIDKIFKEIVKKASEKDLIVLIGIKDDKTDQFLFKSADLVASRTGKRVIVVEVDSLARMTENEVKAIIARLG